VFHGLPQYITFFGRQLLVLPAQMSTVAAESGAGEYILIFAADKDIILLIVANPISKLWWNGVVEFVRAGWPGRAVKVGCIRERNTTWRRWD
jgi:hypothetical protein